MEIVVTASQHLAGKMSHDGLGLEMEVMEHDIRLPTAQEADHVGINACTEESHGTAGP